MKKAAYLIIIGLCLMTAGYSMMRQAELEDRLAKLENQVRIGETKVEEMRKTQLTILELFETMFSKD